MNFNKKLFAGKQLLTDRGVNSIVLYLNEISGPEYDPLNTQEEYDLFVEYRKNLDKKIKDKILKSNLRYVITAAKSYLTHDMKFTNEKAVLEDVINAGNIGLISSFDKYDHTKGFKFLTYATWHIRLHIGIYLNETLADIKLPSNLFRIEKGISKAIALLKSEDEIAEPSIDQIVNKYNIVKDKTEVKLTSGLLNTIRDNKKSFISAHTSLSGIRSNSSGSDEDMILSDTFKQDKEYEADTNIINDSKRAMVNALLNKKLSEREKMIVEYTYGLAGKEEKTLYQIADITGLTRERVGQLLNSAIKKLQESKSAFKTVLA